VPVISALRRLRQEELEFKTNLVFIARPCLKKKKRERIQWFACSICISFRVHRASTRDADVSQTRTLVS
jgi:hypothetical protein